MQTKAQWQLRAFFPLALACLTKNLEKQEREWLIVLVKGVMVEVEVGECHPVLLLHLKELLSQLILFVAVHQNRIHYPLSGALVRSWNQSLVLIEEI